jgi:hypothetical protein
MACEHSGIGQTTSSPMNAHPALSSIVALTPRRTGLCAGEHNTIEVLVRIQAPAAPASHGAQRPPQALALVIDRSGSMAGRPLEEAKRCAEYVLGKLRPADAVALVKFDNRVQRVTARRNVRPLPPFRPVATPTCTAAGKKAPPRWKALPARA